MGEHSGGNPAATQEPTMPTGTETIVSRKIKSLTDYAESTYAQGAGDPVDGDLLRREAVNCLRRQARKWAKDSKRSFTPEAAAAYAHGAKVLRAKAREISKK